MHGLSRFIPANGVLKLDLAMLLATVSRYCALRYTRYATRLVLFSSTCLGGFAVLCVDYCNGVPVHAF